MNIQEWLIQMKTLIEELNTIDLGYPLGDNTIYPPDKELLNNLSKEIAPISPTSPLLELYAYCNGLNLPDVHNGYYIHRIEIILHGIKNGEPIQVKDKSSTPIDILVFGSDGGGGRFAVVKGVSNEVLYLPQGTVTDSTFDGIATPYKVISSDFPGFLERLQGDVRAFIEDTDAWTYIA